MYTITQIVNSKISLTV